MTRLSILHPQYSWHTVPSTAVQLARLQTSTDCPSTPWLLPRFLRIWMGYVHEALIKLSFRYCRWYGIRPNIAVLPLPFGLVLKQSDGTRIEEVAAMKLARRAGLPVPIVISYAEHPWWQHASASILMTRMPGEELFPELWEWYNAEEKQTFITQLTAFLDSIRRWKPTRSDSTIDQSNAAPLIRSAIDTSLRSVRVPRHTIGPCQDEDDFDRALLLCNTTMTPERTREKLFADVATFEKLPRHEIKFTHGDLMFHNLLVMSDGRVSGFLDWECAGWYPSYWEYTTSWALFKPEDWWYSIVRAIGGAEFERERPGDLARRILGTDSGTFSW